jgi:quinol monooxygenase YgiN
MFIWRGPINESKDSMGKFFPVDRREKCMIIVRAKIKAKKGEKDNIISKSQDLIDSSRLDPGNISYNLYAGTEDEDLLIMLEQWESSQALDAHMQTEHFKAFGRAIENIVAEEMDITVYSAEEV